ncbi:hypothetical protein [Neolewinella persica]|uniref:hypothetical protein n=1 Tax=Neolewinella persica TaxID=70998 RepID=UPI000375D042|nr:hypothetical protein [Neolewinella persica]
MKFLLALLSFNFLCVWCFGLQDCSGDDLICEEFLPVLPQLATAIPYENGEVLQFRFEDDPEVISINVFRNEGLIGSQQCQDMILTVLETGDSDRRFRLSLSTDTNGESQLWFDFSFTSLEPEDREFFNLEYDELDVAGVRPPLELRMVADTTLAGFNYQDVAIVRISEVVEPGKISSFIYNRADGLLRVERMNAPAVFRVN